MRELLNKRTEVVSRGPSAANTRGAWNRPAAPAPDRVVRKRRRVCLIGIGVLPFLRSRFQLAPERSEEHTSELQSRRDLVCRLLLEKKKRSNRRSLYW